MASTTHEISAATYYLTNAIEGHETAKAEHTAALSALSVAQGVLARARATEVQAHENLDKLLKARSKTRRH